MSIPRDPTANDDYEVKVQQQIEQYITQPIHELPEIFHVWSGSFIQPGLIAVFGAESINDFYFNAAREVSDGFTRPFRILSIGCGDGTVEVQLAESLRSRAKADFQLIGADLSPVLIERFYEKVRVAQLSDCVIPTLEDLNNIASDETYDLIMANHSLHHILDLEGVFGFIHRALPSHGIFATSDMIGRNGHMRWPETDALLQAVWPMLTDKQKFHHQLLRPNPDRFEDFDCSLEGFEGIRAQDILCLILNSFKPYKFFAYGGFVDVLVDRGFGHGFDAEDEQQRAFITAIAKINEIMLDAGTIKPTVMSAYFTKDDRGEHCYHGRSALRSLRLPFDEPDWVGYHR